MKFTHEEIGAMINSSRETVTRHLKIFREIGLISFNGSKITVNDVPRLLALSDERLMESDRHAIEIEPNYPNAAAARKIIEDLQKTPKY